MKLFKFRFLYLFIILISSLSFASVTTESDALSPEADSFFCIGYGDGYDQKEKQNLEAQGYERAENIEYKRGYNLGQTDHKYGLPSDCQAAWESNVQQIERTDQYKKEEEEKYASTEPSSINPSTKNLFPTLKSEKRKLLPSVGDVNLLTVVIEFADYNLDNPDGDDSTTESIALEMIAENIIGEGTIFRQDKVIKSVNSYYKSASFGKLNLSGEVVSIRLPLNRDEYKRNRERGPDGLPANPHGELTVYKHLFTSALDALDTEIDFSQYDVNEDGFIDGINFIYIGPIVDSFWRSGRAFAYDSDAPWSADESWNYDGKNVGGITYQHLSLTGGAKQMDFNPHTIIHEIAHLFGLPDTYDVNQYKGPHGATGGLGIMSTMNGDFNGYMKWILGWIDPIIISSGAPRAVEIHARSDSELSEDKKGYVIWPDIEEYGCFQELYYVENFQKTGLDKTMLDKTMEPNEGGLLIWHIDGTWSLLANDFLQNNMFTDNKFMHPEQADGLEQVGLLASKLNNEDFYTEGSEFTPRSKPSSNAYDKSFTGVVIKNISESGPIMTAEIGFVEE